MDSLTQKVVEIFSKTPEFKAAEAEAKDTVEQERQANFDRLGEIEGEVVEAVVEPLKALKKLGIELVKAQKIALSTQQKFNAEKIKEMNIRARGDAERARIEQRLKEGAIAGLREFILDASDWWNRERHKWQNGLAPENHEVAAALAKESHKSAPDLDKVKFLASRLKMPARDRISQIRDIIARAEALYFEPNAEKATAELARLKAEIATPAWAA